MRNTITTHDPLRRRMMRTVEERYEGLGYFTGEANIMNITLNDFFAGGMLHQPFAYTVRTVCFSLSEVVQ